MSYRLDSDILAGYFSSSLEYFLTPAYSNKEEMNATTCFVASNCAPTNNRTNYVLQLQKYMPIDSYGKCIHNKDFSKDGVKGGKQKYNTLRKYKFTLAFENHNAIDYVTEKFFHTIAAGSVPIYMGAPNIDDFAPSPKSIIKTTDFRSPEELAQYLLYLDKHDNEYQEYLSWKTEGPQPSFLKLLERHKLDARCRLCLKLAGFNITG